MATRSAVTRLLQVAGTGTVAYKMGTIVFSAVNMRGYAFIYSFTTVVLPAPVSPPMSMPSDSLDSLACEWQSLMALRAASFRGKLMYRFSTNCRRSSTGMVLYLLRESFGFVFCMIAPLISLG